MFVRFAKLLLVLTLSFSIGLHWEVLQSVAWFGMVINYSQGTTLKEGLCKTFDGKHPCCLCKMVQAGKKSENKTDAQVNKISKGDLLMETRAVATGFKPLEFEIFPYFTFFSSRVASPLSPPPKSV